MRMFFWSLPEFTYLKNYLLSITCFNITIKEKLSKFALLFFDWIYLFETFLISNLFSLSTLHWQRATSAQSSRKVLMSSRQAFASSYFFYNSETSISFLEEQQQQKKMRKRNNLCRIVKLSWLLFKYTPTITFLL